jgi:hypothetical protein
MLILLEYQFMFNFIEMYSFFPVSGGVGMGTSALLCPGAYNVIKTALIGSKYAFIIAAIGYKYLSSADK